MEYICITELIPATFGQLFHLFVQIFSCQIKVSQSYCLQISPLEGSAAVIKRRLPEKGKIYCYNLIIVHMRVIEVAASTPLTEAP